MRLTDEERDFLDEWPEPPTTPTGALVHTLANHTDAPDDCIVVPGTSGLYRDADGKVTHTGITLGDLRKIAKRLDMGSVWWSSYEWAREVMRVNRYTAAMWADDVTDGRHERSTDREVFRTWFDAKVAEARGELGEDFFAEEGGRDRG